MTGSFFFDMDFCVCSPYSASRIKKNRRPPAKGQRRRKKSGCGCGEGIHLNRGRRLHKRLHRVGFLRVNDKRRGLRRCIRHRQATDGHFVRRLADDRAVRQLLLVRAGLEASQQRHLVAHLQVAGEARGAAPGDAGDIIALAIGAIDRQHQVGDLATEGGRAVGGQLAQRASQLHLIRVLVAIRVNQMLREARDEQASRALDDLVVAAELTVQRHPPECR